ncbi:MAG: hypothetical protein ACFFB0_06610 [Promethearchaeota archaeon]
MTLLIVITLVSFGVIYSTLFVISIAFYYSDIINIFLWKSSMINYIIVLLELSLLFSFIKEYKKIPIIPYFLFTVLLGLLIGSILSYGSSLILNINTDGVEYSFSFIFSLISIIFQISIIIYLSYINIIIYERARSKRISFFLNFSAFFLNITIIFSILYISFELALFRTIYIFLAWGGFSFVCYILIKAPSSFIVVTNKIYFINIYHKSGVLLYSYNFTAMKNEIESTIWGNILIGLNHILSEFTEKSSQIDVLQTKTSDLVVHYDNLGFAVVIATNRKNAILEIIMNNFANEFKLKYHNELNLLQDLNKLINISEFKETTEIIEKFFKMYL